MLALREIYDLSFQAKNCDVSDFESLKDIAKELRHGKKVEALIMQQAFAMNLAITTPKTLMKKSKTNY